MSAMSPGRRMKYDMTMAARRRRGASSIEARLDAIDASDGDRVEVLKFSAFLEDSAAMQLPELIERHGAEYLGFTEAEIAALPRAVETQTADGASTVSPKGGDHGG